MALQITMGCKPTGLDNMTRLSYLMCSLKERQASTEFSKLGVDATEYMTDTD